MDLSATHRGMPCPEPGAPVAGLGVRLRPAGAPDAPGWPATVSAVVDGGVLLLAPRPFRAGEFLALGGGDPGAPPVEVPVRWSSALPRGGYGVFCGLPPGLGREQLAALARPAAGPAGPG